MTDSFNPEHGFRQGDPLLPYLFILCFEYLSRILRREEMDGNLHGIKVFREAPAISHLLYTNDLLMACRATDQEAAFAMKSFHKYCERSGQEANWANRTSTIPLIQPRG